MTDSSNNFAKRVLTDPVNLLAFGFGTGLSPIAPGTVGSLLGVGLAWMTRDLQLIGQAGIAVGLILGGIWICGESARRIGVHDHADGLVARLCPVPSLRYRQTMADSRPGSQNGRRSRNYAG